jgi:hypothetical protein
MGETKGIFASGQVVTAPASIASIAAVRSALDIGRIADAVSRVLDVFGPEIYGFVTAALLDSAAACHAYAAIAVAIQRDLPGFGWLCTLRTFLYFLARRELRQRRERGVDLVRPHASAIDRAWLCPSRHGRTGTFVAELQRRLGAEDRELLVLHVDRGLTWRQLACTSLGERAGERELAGESHRIQHRVLAVRTEIEELTRCAERRARTGKAP